MCYSEQETSEEKNILAEYWWAHKSLFYKKINDEVKIRSERVFFFFYGNGLHLIADGFNFSLTDTDLLQKHSSTAAQFSCSVSC